MTGTADYPDSHKDLLDAKGFAHMATIGPEGEPHSSPVWYDWTGSEVLISHTDGRQKYRNVRQEPRVALSILDPENPYRYLEIRGSVVIEPDPEKTLIHNLAKKYLGKDRYPYDGPNDHRVIFRIIPTRINGYG